MLLPPTVARTIGKTTSPAKPVRKLLRQAGNKTR